MSLAEILNKYKTSKRVIIFILSAGLYIVRKLLIPVKQTGGSTVIVSLKKLGDSVFTIPAIIHLQEKSKEKIVLICFGETEPVYRSVFNDMEIVTLEHNEFSAGDRFAKYSARRKLARLKPSEIIDLTCTITSAFLIFNTRAEKITGTNDEYFKRIYTDFLSVNFKGHLSNFYLQIAESITGADSIGLNNFYRKNYDPEGIILIHPFAGWPAKEWNLNKFIRLSEALSAEYDCVLISPPGKIVDDVKDEIARKDIKYVETNNVRDLMKELGRSALVISNDSGPLQIAALMGKPTFTIFGPTNPQMHLPSGDHHRFIRHELKCSPHPDEKFCFTNAGRNGCPSFECMNLLSYEKVQQDVLSFISYLGIIKKMR